MCYHIQDLLWNVVVVVVPLTWQPGPALTHAAVGTVTAEGIDSFLHTTLIVFVHVYLDHVQGLFCKTSNLICSCLVLVLEGVDYSGLLS